MQACRGHMAGHAIRLPLLITGLAGVPGYNAFRYFRGLFGDRVQAIRQQKNWRLQEPGVLACDAEDADALARLFGQHHFQSILSFGGSCRLKACETDHAMAWRVNVEGAQNVVRLAARYNARMVHLSSDLVFAGRPGGGYSEDDPPDPVTMYGRTMVEAERRVLEILPSACVLRISLPMGISFNGHAGAIDWIESRFAKDRPATLYYDEVRTPSYVACMNRLYERLLADQTAGLYHAGGPRRLSLFEIAQIINRVGGYDPEKLHGCLRFEAGPLPPRAGDVTMDSTRLLARFGSEIFAPWPRDARLVPNRRDWHFDRSGDEALGLGSPEAVQSLLT